MHVYSTKCTVCLEPDTEGRESFIFRLLWPCVMNVGWRERNQQDATNLVFIVKLLYQYVSGIIIPIFRMHLVGFSLFTLQSSMFKKTFRLKILEDIQVLLRQPTSASGNYTYYSLKFFKIGLAQKHSEFSPHVGSPYWKMHDLISCAVIILFSSLFADSFFFILWVFFHRNICFSLFLRFSFCLSILHFFFPWLCVSSFLASIRIFFFKELGLEAVYVMDLSDVIGEESLSPPPVSTWEKVTVQATCTINPLTSTQLLYDLVQFFCSLIWGNSL